jgi:DNA-binding response OmpR family regulator
VDKRGKILVVDDDQAICDVLGEFLGELGFEVKDAPGGVEALAQMERDPPDVVLLDIRMPGMDGVETLRRIRQITATMPVLMITGNDDVETAKDTVRLGAFDCVAKPFDFGYLERAVHKMFASTKAAGPAPGVVIEPSSRGLAYDLALEVFRATSGMSARSHASLGSALESAALGLAQNAGDKLEVVRALNQIRIFIRFARDLGELSDDVHRQLESYVVRARRSVGLT